MRADRVSEPWAAITGAGSGLGREIAIALGKRGFGLQLAGRRRPPLEETARRSATPTETASIDVRDVEALRSWAEDTVRRWGPPAIVVPGAGAAAIRAADELLESELRDLLEVNLVGAVATVRAFLPALRAAGRGTICLLLSVAARTGFPGWSAYCASKAGLAGYARALRAELQGSGVGLLEVYPGATDTPIWDALPGTWNRNSMMRGSDVAAIIVDALAADRHLRVEELHLGPPGGAL
jgi:NAD(P)-dependent dehydrogenase (short-subunit alcohol dehydrogenase family)